MASMPVSRVIPRRAQRRDAPTPPRLRTTTELLAAQRKSAAWSTYPKASSGFEVAEAEAVLREIEHAKRLPRVRTCRE